MKYFDWSEEKNVKLKRDRNISFEIIVSQIELGFLIDIIGNPNQSKYNDQNLLVVEYEDYVYLVPFIEDDKKVFLKQLFPLEKRQKNI